jgi:hypothetical protein
MAGNISSRSDEIAALLAARGPLSLEVLARLVNVAPVALGRYLDEHPYLVPTPEGEWVSGLRLADGVAFTHELSAIEVASGMLSADDDLALWAQFAVGGRPLAGGGEVKATTVLDLPSGIGDLPAGQGMIGQLLTGPDGWLAGFSAGDLLSVRLRGGALEISARKPPKHTVGTGRVRDVCAFAAVEALKQYAEGAVDHPFVPLDEILITCCSRNRRSSRRRCRRWLGRCGRLAWRPSAEASASGARRGIWPGSAGSTGQRWWRARWRSACC